MYSFRSEPEYSFLWNGQKTNRLRHHRKGFRHPSLSEYPFAQCPQRGVECFRWCPVRRDCHGAAPRLLPGFVQLCRGKLLFVCLILTFLESRRCLSLRWSLVPMIASIIIAISEICAAILKGYLLQVPDLIHVIRTLKLILTLR